MKKFISIFAAVSMLASMFVMPAVHADYTFDRNSANFIAGTDFENNNPTSGHAYAFMNDTTNTELSNSIKHSGTWSLHTTAESKGNAVLNTHNWSWAYWNSSTDANSRGSALTVGETYKYSYWVYADESATVFTPSTLVSNGSGGSDWKIENKNYSGLKKKTWNYFETVFTAKAKSLPFFYDIPANLYIDDIKLEKVVGPTLVSTTLPEENGIAELGYNKYTMTFDKNIKSATVYINGRNVTPAISGKTVEFEKRNKTAGEAVTVTVNATDTDGIPATVTRAFTVSSNTLVAYADFDDSGVNEWHYFNDNRDKTSLVDVACYSPSKGAKLAPASGKNITLQTSGDGRVTGTKAIVKDNWYKMSFWAKPASETNTQTPQFCIAQNNISIQWVAINNAAMTKYEVAFKSNSTSLPVFFGGAHNGDIIIDDILIQETIAPAFVSTTLPEENGIAELGYNKYTMTFDKDIASATVSINGSSVTPAISGKTVEFGLRLTDGGEKTIDVTVKNSDGASTTVSRKINVPQTLVAYAGFDDNSSYNISHYLTNVGGGALISTEGDYYSPKYAAKIVDTDPYWSDIRFNTASWSGVKFNNTKAVETGKWYKMSFYAKRVDSAKTPVLGVAQENTSCGKVTINSDTMTKYEVTFKATMTNMPRFYREQKDGDIYIDDILIQEVEAPRDYTFTANAGKITAGATLTATLTNERLGSMDGIVIMALYKDKRFVEAKMVTASSLAKFASVTTDAITVPADISDGVYTAKAFLWDKTLVPMQSAVVIEEETE